MFGLDFIGGWDIFVVAAYIIVVCVVALRVRFHQNTDDDYYLAGRNTHWIFISISTFATLFSTLSFVMVPAEAWEHGLQLFLVAFVGMPLLPVAAHVMLKFFFLSPNFTAYEYLERRYNRFCRFLGALFFCTARFMYMAIVLYATSIIFNSIFKIPILAVILVVGILTLSYTLIGGMRAVIFTDFIQSIMLLIGIIAILYFISKGLGFHWLREFKNLAATDERFTFSFLRDKEFYKIGYHDRLNILLILFAVWHQPFMSVSSDQLVVQRLLSTKGFKSACKAIYGNLMLAIPVILLIWGIGIGLVMFYKHHALPEGMLPKDVLGYFISTQLPSPIPGIMCAAMLAMIMSTIDSTINSLSAVVQHDILPNLPGNFFEKMTVSRKWSAGSRDPSQAGGGPVRKQTRPGLSTW